MIIICESYANKDRRTGMVGLKNILTIFWYQDLADFNWDTFITSFNLEGNKKFTYNDDVSMYWFDYMSGRNECESMMGPYNFETNIFWNFNHDKKNCTELYLENHLSERKHSTLSKQLTIIFIKFSISKMFRPVKIKLKVVSNSTISPRLTM